MPTTDTPAAEERTGKTPILGRRAFLGGFAAAAVASALPSPLSAAPLARVKELGVLRVAVYRDNRPWSWNEGGRLTGIDVELAGALAAQLGVRADINEFMAGDDMAADLRNAVWRGGLLGFQPCDVMMHVPFDHKLQTDNDQVAILAPYYRESFAAACGPRQADCEVPPADFRGDRLSAAIGSVPDLYLLGSFGGVLRAGVSHYNTGYDAVAALGERKADVAVATRAEVEAALHDMDDPGIKRRKGMLQGMMSPGWDIAMAVKENSRTLGDALENIVNAMSGDGRLRTLFAAHGVEWRAALAA